MVGLNLDKKDDYHRELMAEKSVRLHFWAEVSSP